MVLGNLWAGLDTRYCMVEATPERAAKPAISAEEPVTKKILNRPKVEIEVQHVNGEVGARMVDRIQRVARWAR